MGNRLLTHEGNPDKSQFVLDGLTIGQLVNRFPFLGQVDFLKFVLRAMQSVDLVSTINSALIRFTRSREIKELSGHMRMPILTFSVAPVFRF